MNDTITIRPASREDATALALLIRGIGWFRALEGELEKATMQRVAGQLERSLEDHSHSVYVAERPGHGVVGYVAAHWLPYLILSGPEGFISELFIENSSRGAGIGRRLLDTVIAEARERGCTRLQLLNMRGRDSYRRGFYQKLGWEERPDAASFVYRIAD